mmetsp:Transcript_22764/g.25343  ORF Transcript_22764/g.25343 Transcript_22764/m.25343 type:complete len:334 (+) Transcript_22764:71-1072(+)
MSRPIPIVCVTGASGYIGSHVVDLLLSQGYRVRGTVRSVKNENKVKHLAKYTTLELFEADLLQQKSFAKAFSGCTYVIHVASPFQLLVSDPQKELVDPAVNGTVNVLTAARDAGVSRVVLTSSIAAVEGLHGRMSKPGVVLSEKDWNTTSSLTKDPYAFSKVEAEKAAWAFVKANPSLELAVINPGFVIGPSLSAREDATSMKLVKTWVGGMFAKRGAPHGYIPSVDVRDVALGHIRAMIQPNAKDKRFLFTATRKPYSFLELFDMISSEYPQFPLPRTLSKRKPKRKTYPPIADNSRATDILRIHFIPIDESIRDMVRDMIRKRLINLNSNL